MLLHLPKCLCSLEGTPIPSPMWPNSWPRTGLLCGWIVSGCSTWTLEHWLLSASAFPVISRIIFASLWGFNFLSLVHHFSIKICLYWGFFSWYNEERSISHWGGHLSPMAFALMACHVESLPVMAVIPSHQPQENTTPSLKTRFTVCWWEGQVTSWFFRSSGREMI